MSSWYMPMGYTSGGLSMNWNLQRGTVPVDRELDMIFTAEERLRARFWRALDPQLNRLARNARRRWRYTLNRRGS